MRSPGQPIAALPTEGAHDHDIEGSMLRLVAERGPGKSVCPSEVARGLTEDEARWRALMPRVRATAVRLAAAGRITILRKGKAVDPHAFKGVYRLSLPE